MKRNVWIGGLAAIVLTYGGLAAAQTAGSATSDQKSSGSTMTITGCLARADEAGGATGTTGSTATPPSSSASSSTDKFVLKNAKSGSSSPSSSTTTATPPSTTGTSGSTYMLEGKTSDLKMHVGHQVEITGKLAGDSSSTSRSSTSTSAAGATSSSSSTMSGQKLEVESVRMIASTCSSR